ncbi:regulatory protein RecX [Dyella mobilis]|uniref:Regulatory protein RecX n=1 Tax=Dyella mobilis TaxID=1849582 RepID=A0ABS2KLQ4_9GAMM|nr:regulatory protein RecX [Dyella mobilis]MBM7131712.1 regulatory protein RecX [Dyella mobilis]GLQ96312.1 regulatory protein RecX [Dyella mobilis]
MKRKSADGDSQKNRPSAYNKALGMLARREHSRRELRQKLDRGGYAGDEANEALDRLGQQHYQDDDRFAELLIRSRSAQGYGPMRVRAELKSHGLPDARIRNLLNEAGLDWTGIASAQLRRRYGSAGTSDPSERARRAQFLLRRGFPAATVRDVTHADVDDAADDAP